jgi:hypothetical protein
MSPSRNVSGLGISYSKHRKRGGEMVRKLIKPYNQLVLEIKQELLKDQKEIERLEKKIEEKLAN